MKTIVMTAPCPRSGKDTLAALIKDKHVGKVFITSFGKALRETVAALFPHMPTAEFIRMSHEDGTKDTPMECFCPAFVASKPYFEFLWSQGFTAHTPMSARQHLQLFGNDYTKGVLGLKTHWVDCVVRELNLAIAHGVDVSIVTDCRFPVESEAMAEKFDAKFIRVERAGKWPENAVSAAPKHVAETLIDQLPCDLRVWNLYGDKEGLLRQFTDSGLI